LQTIFQIRVNIKDLQRTQATQQQENIQPDFKMDKDTECLGNTVKPISEKKKVGKGTE
jgi:hypothetical protein